MATEGDRVEGQIDEWRTYMRRRRTLTSADADELEDHLRGRMADLADAGLEPEEAFLVAVKRMGSLDALTREFAREHSDRLWKQLVLAGDPREPGAPPARADVVAMVACAVAAAVAVKLPAVFGLSMDADAPFYARNAGLFGLAPLASYFLWRRRAVRPVIRVTVLLFLLGAVGANAFLAIDGRQTDVLTAIHLPIALWLTVGFAYVAGEWRSDVQRMDFVRFTGEWSIYYALIALGGGVLSLLTLGTFDAIGVKADDFVSFWLLPCGAAGAVVVAGWLVEAKKSVIENMAPVLTWVFTPLFLVALIALVTGVVATGHGIHVDRDVLIVFDLLLAVILGLLLYGVSARESTEPARATWFDWLRLALVSAALAVDALVLVAVVGRISEFGFSANKTAALGENVVLLVNLLWSGWLLLGFLRRQRPFVSLERWQTGYITVYLVWAWVVVLVFPLVFDLA